MLSGDNALVINDFKASAAFLDKHIQESDKVLIISGGGWNTPMIGWQRKVYRIGWHYGERIPEELPKNYDYFVTHNAYFEQSVLAEYPDFYTKFEKIRDNDKVSIWIYKKG